MEIKQSHFENKTVYRSSPLAKVLYVSLFLILHDLLGHKLINFIMKKEFIF